MELIFLDKDFRPMCAPVDDYSALKWVRNYHDLGQFELRLSPRLYDIAMSAVYLYNNGSDETAVITGREYFAGDEESITIKGYSLEYLLSRRCINEPEIICGNLESEIRRLVRKYAMTGGRAIEGLTLGSPMGLGDIVDDQVCGENLSSWIYDALKPLGCSYRLYYDFAADQIIFEIWRGLDRTQDQTVNQPALFSADFENIVDVRYLKDEQNYKNFAYVAYEYTPDPIKDEAGNKIPQDAVRLEVSVDKRLEGEEPCEIYVSPRYLNRKDEEGNFIPDEQLKAAMEQLGIEELGKYGRVLKADGQMNDTNSLRYMEGYNLGDLCDFALPKRGLAFSARITRVTETNENGIFSVSPVIGEDYLTFSRLMDGKK